jgi:alpha-amylase
MKVNSLFAGLALSALTRVTIAADISAWASRSLYQVVTDRFAQTVADGSKATECTNLNNYCGGTFQGIIDNLDYIQGMGFTAIQVSPITTNIEGETKYGEAYHGYWPNDIYTINSHFGTSDDLVALSKALHDRGMYLLVDVVINDMAIAYPQNVTDPSALNYSSLTPFDAESDFNPFCNITNFNDPAIYQNCWFGVEYVVLPSLDVSQKNISSVMFSWIKDLVSNYSIDGLRIDGAKQSNPTFLHEFQQSIDIFIFGEVYTGDVNGVCSYEANVTGLENYPLYGPMIQAFTAGALEPLPAMVASVEQACTNWTGLKTFSENQDLVRIGSLVNDTALAKNIIAFTILADGIPSIYQGQEQFQSGNYSPYNRAPLWPTNYDNTSDLYQATALYNTIRNHAISIDSRYATNHSALLHIDGSAYATAKGVEGYQIVAVYSNQGTGGGAYNLSFAHAYPAGTNVTEITSCNTSIAYATGNITVEMFQGQPRVFFPTNQLNGSGLCGSDRVATNLTSGSGSSGNSSSSSGGGAKKNDSAMAGVYAPTLMAGLLMVMTAMML